MGHDRLVIYCLVPRESAALAGPLRKHYRNDPRVEVIVDRRVGERRRGTTPPLGQVDRRAGADRRRRVLPRAITPLPARLAKRAEGVRWIQRMLPVGDELEGLDTAAVVERHRDGDASAATELYWRYYERVYSRLSVLLGDPRRADELAPQAFGRVLDAIDAGAAEGHPFEEVLYREVDALTAPAEAPGDDDAAAEPGFVATVSGLRLVGAELDETVGVYDRNPLWAGMARSERDRLVRRLPSSVSAIEHVGSTAVAAVPAARAIVDLLVGVKSAPDAAELRQALESVGYRGFGSAGVRGREYFRKRAPSGRFDIHAVEHGGPLWNQAIALRDHLVRHPSDAVRWAQAKRSAAREAQDSLLRYLALRQSALDQLLAKLSPAAA